MSSFSDLVLSLRDESRPLSLAELRRLSGIDRARADELAHLWTSFSTARRRQIVRSLVELAESTIELNFGETLKICLRDPDEDVRVEAIEGLWEDEETSTALRLLEVLATDASVRVRATAAAGLATFVYRAEMAELSPTTTAALRRGLLASIDSPAEAPEVRRRAVEAIAYLTTPEVHRIIERSYADPDEKMRASAVFAMGRNCDAGWVDTILRELGSPSPEMRYEAARAAGDLEDERAVRPLVSLLVDGDREVRLAAIAALGAIGGATARRALEYTLKNGDDEARSAAAEALEELTFSEDPIGVRPRITDDQRN